MAAYDGNNINCQLIPESYMWIIHCTVQWWRLIRSCLIFPPQEDNIYQYLRAFPDKCKAESNLGMAVQVFFIFFLFWEKRYHHRTKARFTFTVSLNLQPRSNLLLQVKYLKKTKTKSLVFTLFIFSLLPLQSLSYHFHFPRSTYIITPSRTPLKFPIFSHSTPKIPSCPSFHPPDPLFLTHQIRRENEQTTQTTFRAHKSCFVHSGYNLLNLPCYHNPYCLLHCFQA